MSCSSNSQVVNPHADYPPDVIWSNRGLDTCMVFALLADESYILAGRNDGIFKSTNNGDKWIHMNPDSLNSGFANFCMLPGGSVLTSISGKGIFRSSDRGSSRDYLGLRNVTITAAAADSQGKFLQDRETVFMLQYLLMMNGGR